MLARVLGLLALLASVPASAQSLAGSWALEVGGTTMFRFDLSENPEGEWHATWSRPNSFGTDGTHFSKVSGPLREVQEMTLIPLDTDNAIEVSFDDPRPHAIPDIFDIRLVDSDTAQLTYVGTGLAAFTLHRVAADAALGPWDPQKTYGGATGPGEETDAPASPAVNEAPSADLDSFKLRPPASSGR
jgi:hypothetical protein